MGGGEGAGFKSDAEDNRDPFSSHGSCCKNSSSVSSKMDGVGSGRSSWPREGEWLALRTIARPRGCRGS